MASYLEDISFNEEITVHFYDNFVLSHHKFDFK